MAIVGVGDSHTSAEAELLRAHGCPIPILADRFQGMCWPTSQPMSVETHWNENRATT